MSEIEEFMKKIKASEEKIGFWSSSRHSFECELCEKSIPIEEFLQHLDSHSRQEVEALRKLAYIAIHNQDGYENLKLELLTLEHQEHVKREKKVCDNR
jgi:cephalosporin-C deacetylase-like acetyl esterase